MRRFGRGLWVAGSFLLPLTLQAGQLHAQGVMGTLTIDGSFLQLPTLQRDSFPESEVPGDGLVRQQEAEEQEEPAR
ncbi:MAG: hypothetical protein KAI98_02275 [Gemmatimonadetes bacterium]|nr:hypothetical protein [Gemmatimonadota bacterium]MCK5488781.1 hypothetical protein [Gemmatimonadota bacterium]